MATHPVIKALRHHKTAVVLIVLEIALTLAIIANALLVVDNRIGRMRVQTGLANGELIWLRTSGIDTTLSAGERTSRFQADMATLRALPGVRSVAMVNSIPLSTDSYQLLRVYAHPGSDTCHCDASIYTGTPGFLDTLGLTLEAGRPFGAQDHLDYDFYGGAKGTPPPVMVSRSMANALWPGEDPLGKPLYLDKDGLQVTHVVGVTSYMASPVPRAGMPADMNLVFPVQTVRAGTFVLRVSPDAVDRLMGAIPQALARVDDNRVVMKVQTLDDSVRSYFHDDRTLVQLLLAVVASLLLITGLGIFGLTGFWVQERARFIGIRRALGATRRDIRHYFQLENLAIVSFGVALGIVSALALNLWLLVRYELPRLPLAPLLGGAALLFLLGQVAVWQPARRACRVPPAAATRSA